MTKVAPEGLVQVPEVVNSCNVAPAETVVQDGKPEPELVSTCPLVPAAPARVKAVVKLADAIVGAVRVLLVSVSVPVYVAILAAAKVVWPVPPLAIGKVPVTPVDKGKPVAFVSVALVGVPKIGVTNVGLVDNTVLPEPVEVVTPVPPLATANVPANVIVPALVTGPPLVVSPVVPPDTATLVTEPEPGPVNAI
jgi:hypothetical protein